MSDSSQYSDFRDVIELLLSQHEQVKSLLAKVENSAGTERADAFLTLAAFLQRHEQSEQKVIHPITRDDADGGREVAAARLHEEHEADEALAELRQLGPDHPDFITKFSQFRRAVLSHAEREEQEEFPLLRQVTPADQLVKMADDVISAQAEVG